MNKLLLIALGIASASAAYEYSNTMVSNEWLIAEMDIEMDAYYTTTYSSDSNDQAYGVKFDSYIAMSFLVEVFSWYYHTVTFMFTPLRIVPYEQDLAFTRPVEM
jgi:hypothetical protein